MDDRLGTALLAWFHRAQRPLPWRGPLPRDPYRVLVSEVMLQQTQVERVVPAFVRFLELFPTLGSLAAAPVDDVLAAWTGLGYYRRGRLLHAAARAIEERGSWPRTREELASLPGLGPYTSAALAAFAFGGGDPPVDGNVSRVTSRVAARALAMGSGPLLREGETFARGLFAEVGSPEVWEALMELGARVCTPRAPRCEECPWQASCRAFAQGRPEDYPLPRPQRASEAHRWVALWLLRDDGRVLLRRVDDGPLLGGVWLPPFAALPADAAPDTLARELATTAGFAGPLRPAPAVGHSITHRRIQVLPFAGAAGPPAAVAEPRVGWRWEPAARPTVATSTLFAKIRDACRTGLLPVRAEDGWPAAGE